MNPKLTIRTSIHSGAKTMRLMHIFSLLYNSVEFLTNKEKVYVTMTDTTEYAGQQDLFEKYKLFLTHFPIEILYLGSNINA